MKSLVGWLNYVAVAARKWYNHLYNKVWDCEDGKEMKGMRKITAAGLAAVMAACFVQSTAVPARANIIIHPSDITKYYDEGGSHVRDGWVKLTNASGASVWRYADKDGEYLHNTTTPDGYKVNDFKNWYLHCPSAEICEAEPVYQMWNGGLAYPFSYDGEVAKNDALGVSFRYGETDYQQGYELSMTNGHDPMSFSAFNITKTPEGAFVSFSIDAHKTKQDMQDYAASSYADEIYVEREFCGKPMIGTASYWGDRDKYGDRYYYYALRYQLPTGSDLEIWITQSDDLEKTLSWLESHLTLAK